MADAPQIPVVPKPPVDPVQRSIAKPDAFCKPAAFKDSKAKSSPKNTRIRTMDWKRGKGRPRKMPFDVRDVKYF